MLFLVVSVAGAEATAGVAEDIERLCKISQPDNQRRREGCRSRHTEAAGHLGRKLEKGKNDSEIRQIFERCAKPHRMEDNLLDWYRINLCFDRESRPYRNFKKTAAAAETDTFTRKIVGFCRTKRTYRSGAFTWRERERCRQQQREAGEAVAELYRKTASGSIAHKGMDSCAREHRNDKGQYDWQIVKRCIDNFMRR
ncbi:MAG: hypothetical protein QF893_10995 [Alphaproteobacteria bacterium]|nr:hypothetical protein [Alphaproteobacteria bacterium]